MAKLEISLSPAAVFQINQALSNGKEVRISVRGGRLIIWELSSKKKYDVVVATPH